MKYLLCSLLAVTLTLLSSCIDGEEEIFIHADGSGSMTLVYKVPSVIFTEEDSQRFSAMVTEKIGGKETLRLVTNKVEKVNAQRVITIKVEADNVVEFQSMMLSDDGSEKGDKSDWMMRIFMGETTFTRDGLSAGMIRKVELAPLLKRYGMSPSLLGNSEFRYTVHVPKAVDSSNAHIVESGGKVLKWTFKLSECQQKPIVMMLTAPVPIPWWVYAVVGLIGLVVVWLAWRLLKWIKVRKTSQRP